MLSNYAFEAIKSREIKEVMKKGCSLAAGSLQSRPNGTFFPYTMFYILQQHTNQQILQHDYEGASQDSLTALQFCGRYHS
jgi:hypothetical protein